MTSEMLDGPRLLRDPAEVARRTREIDRPHVAPLNAWVRDLRTRFGPTAIIPWFDPWDAGVNARILWLLESPGPRATRERGGSGFISCNNNDRTAENTFNTRTEAGVARSLVVHWNAIPFYLGSDTRQRAWTPTDVAYVGPLLPELLQLLPNLVVVILGGKAAQKTWERHAPPDTPVASVSCPHPSATNINTRPWCWEQIVDAWQRAQAIVSGRAQGSSMRTS